MVVLHNSVLIRCSPEEAFDYLSDLRAELEWNPGCQSMEKITEGPVGVGTRFRAKWKSSPLVEVEFTRYDRPRSWSAHNGGPIEVSFTCHLEPVPEGTLLRAEFAPRPHGWFRLVFPLFLLVISREEKANMIRIREALERRTQVRP
ncbi:SRPBCC family protein [Lentzea terrae]|uniref:SRPBCC family protein n=1 Tax=Lentzea terrae TaxID=2200761 RepID=UPI00130067A7|nr:SRPBCC family protein [Lentzea terrae]